MNVFALKRLVRLVKHLLAIKFVWGIGIVEGISVVLDVVLPQISLNQLKNGPLNMMMTTKIIVVL